MFNAYKVPLARCTATQHDVHSWSHDEPQQLQSYKPNQPKAVAGDKYYYGLRIMTGSAKCAGGETIKCVYIKLIGSRAQSDKVSVTSLTALRKGSFMRKKYDDIVIGSQCDLGDILVVVVGISGEFPEISLEPDWFVDFMVVHNFQSNENKDFPCYNWLGVGDYVSCTAQTTTVKDVASTPVLMEQRQEQLSQRRELYQWKLYPDKELPSHIYTSVSHLPPDEKFHLVKDLDFTADALKAASVLGLTDTYEPCNTLHEYEVWARKLGQPSVPVSEGARWEMDVEFGRQMLNGVNPVVIEKCTSLPPNFPVTNEMVKGFLNTGLSLEGEMETGHVYICNLKIMDNLPCRQGYYSCAPMCLLYVNGSGQLVPIAIQLNQKPGDDNPIFLPSDHLLDWLLAKIHYQSAHSQFHELSTHYLSCHAAMEVYAMATMRNLPDPHPINKLLRPHFRYTMAINARARQTLINTGGIIDRTFAIGGGKEELIKRAFAAYSVYCTNIKRNIKERGVENRDQLPGYYYCDDGLKLWEAMETCVTNIVDEFYQSNDDVKSDSELQTWASEIHDIGFPAFETSSAGHGFPDKIDSKAELVELCTQIMFTGSAQHAAVNFGQYDLYGFVPNAPFGMRCPPPKKKGSVNLQLLLESLPDRKTTVSSIGVAYLLSQYSHNEVFLGSYTCERFTEKAANTTMKQFQDDLGNITSDILDRNASLDVPYTFLLPGKVPNSITI